MALILIADDDQITRSILREALVRCGHHVLEAENGRECLHIMTFKVPDLIIVDIFMPDLDGLETIQEVSEKWPDVKIVCMSGGSDRYAIDYLEAAKDFGAIGVMRKPFTFKQVADLVGALL